MQGVPTDLEKIILRCLRKDPERRFQHIGDVKAVRQALHRELDGAIVHDIAFSVIGPDGEYLTAASVGSLHRRGLTPNEPRGPKKRAGAACPIGVVRTA